MRAPPPSPAGSPVRKTGQGARGAGADVRASARDGGEGPGAGDGDGVGDGHTDREGQCPDDVKNLPSILCAGRADLGR